MEGGTCAGVVMSLGKRGSQHEGSTPGEGKKCGTYRPGIVTEKGKTGQYHKKRKVRQGG